MNNNNRKMSLVYNDKHHKIKKYGTQNLTNLLEYINITQTKKDRTGFRWSE
jgi:hypothetical protein